MPNFGLQRNPIFIQIITVVISVILFFVILIASQLAILNNLIENRSEEELKEYVPPSSRLKND